MSKTYWSQRIEELANSEKDVPDTVFFTSEAYRSYTETAAKDMMRIQHFRDGRRQARQCVGG